MAAVSNKHLKVILLACFNVLLVFSNKSKDDDMYVRYVRIQRK